MPISEVERKLAAYRAKKEREALINHYKVQVNSMFSKFMKKNDREVESETEREGHHNLHLSPECDINSDDDIDALSENEEASTLSPLDYTLYLLWFILWLTVCVIAFKLELVMAYLILSAIAALFVNTRTGPKRKNELSAYSVFNKNCERIDGTLDAEQLTRQMVYGGLGR